MSMEFIAIISVGVTMLGVGAALAGLIITGQNGLRTEMREQRKEMQEQEVRLGKEIRVRNPPGFLLPHHSALLILHNIS